VAHSDSTQGARKHLLTKTGRRVRHKVELNAISRVGGKNWKGKGERLRLKAINFCWKGRGNERGGEKGRKCRGGKNPDLGHIERKVSGGTKGG